MKALVVFCVSIIILLAIRSRTNLLPPQEQLISGAAAFAFLVRWQNTKKRSRYIPKKTRKAVIERDLKGEKFDSTIH
ncbi:MAG TPA: hypothetical protein VG456_04710, partial [Candidatus Sulfopaludibacter sp.]|nr:hypothetical protein [Candidatus Sulfopaludibacter sp.]